MASSGTSATSAVNQSVKRWVPAPYEQVLLTVLMRADTAARPVDDLQINAGDAFLPFQATLQRSACIPLT
jgi:hypothetical protein